MVKAKPRKKGESREILVLRTVYLSKKIDDQLRDLAFMKSVSKNDLIRGFVTEGLKKIKQSQSTSGAGE